MNGELYRRARVLAGQWAAEPDAVPHNLAAGATEIE
jgi:hypothetical protein